MDRNETQWTFASGRVASGDTALDEKPQKHKDGAIGRDDFRALMRQHAAGVTIIATGAPGNRAGLTATAVASLTDDPPTVLVCIGQKTGVHALLPDFEIFSVNLLAADQVALADRFAGRCGLSGEARFDAAAWRAGLSGAPILNEALASMECRLTSAFDATTHTVFMGRILASSVRETAEPLVYVRAGYHRVERL